MVKKRGTSHRNKTRPKHIAKHAVHHHVSKPIHHAEHHHVHEPEHHIFRKKEALPPGIKVLIAYASVVCIFYLIYLLFGIKKPVSIFFGMLLTGSSALMVDIISLCLLVAIIIGLKRRDYWTFWLSLGWFSYGVLNAIVSVFLIQTQFMILKELMLLSAVSILILNGLIVWYIYSEKEYFKTKHLNKVTKAKDKVFVYIIASVLIVSILFTITLGLNFYKTTIKTANEIIHEMDTRGANQMICEEKTNQEKDICYVVLTIATEAKESSLCDNIESDFYKLTCYRALT
jgi:hypothetical protein